MRRFEVGVVIDITVERGHYIRTAERHDLLLVQGVSVRFRDDADAGPPRMGEHDAPSGVGPNRQVQERVVHHRRAQGTRVVAELADFGGSLVDEREIAFRRAHGLRTKQSIVGAAAEQTGDCGVVEIEPVAGDVNVQAGGIATAYLEAIERREGDLH